MSSRPKPATGQLRIKHPRIKSMQPPTTFLLLDLENIQPDGLSALTGSSFRIKVFLGSHQTKVPVALARALQAFGSDAEYIQMEGSGHNALDFHIAYYLGRLAVEHPKAQFRIISKDAGFDPLVCHLRARKLLCERLPSLAGLHSGPLAGNGSPPDRIKVVIADLIKRQAARPRTPKTLSSTIQALFQKKLTDDELQGILDELSKRGVVKVSDGKLGYELPKQL
jgi:PIN domain